MKKLLTSLCFMLVWSMTLHAQRVITVAQDGSGDYTTIQAAIDAAPAEGQVIIRVKAGNYAENVSIGSRQHASKQKISMVGEGIDKTVITSAIGMKTAPKGRDIYATAALAVYADDFYAQDITFRNTAGKKGGQALAIFVGGDRQTFFRCQFSGFQDTHRTKKGTRSYFRDCTIEGAVDYIYAGGTAWFERCRLNSVAPGYITAPEDINVSIKGHDGNDIYLGFIFNRCTVTVAEGVSESSVSLGRCWGAEKCGSIFMNSDLGKAIAPAGWATMGGNDGKKSYYGEYHNTDATGNLADTKKRIGWSHQLSDDDYQKIDSWAKVDAAFRSATGKGTAYTPEDVIRKQQLALSAKDYTETENSLLAFPTARGFGKYTSGGRGGKVVEVTTLADSGEGSLRWALTEAGNENATIIFRVSGIINIGPNPNRPAERAIRAKLKNVTIAGQTAPGEGILIRGGKLNFGGSENVIIRNIRARLGKMDDGSFIEGGSIGVENARNIIVDHCCFGWSGEENMTFYDNHFTTVQWCIVHEGLFNAGHKKGARGYGCQWGGSPGSFHHNLLAHNDSRSARLNGASNPGGDRNVFMEYFNNVNYNWGRQNSCYGGESEAGPMSSHECNFVGNYYKPGPARQESSYFIEISQARKGKTLTNPSAWYLAGNKMEGNEAATVNNWLAVNNKTGFNTELLRKSEMIYPSAAYTRMENAQIDNYDRYRTPVETADEALANVLAKAGTINRDATEWRVIEDVKNGTARYRGASAGKGGIIDTQAEAEGWPTYAMVTAVADNDHDGMADDWEVVNGFDPTNPEDRNTIASKEGYTALEIYLNSLMGENINITIRR